jgi:hypothetical protein
MRDWSEDAFMSSWDKTYVSTNVKAGAKEYDKDFFLSIHQKLASVGHGLEIISPAIIVRISQHTLSPNGRLADKMRKGSC